MKQQLMNGKRSEATLFTLLTIVPLLGDTAVVEGVIEEEYNQALATRWN